MENLNKYYMNPFDFVPLPIGPKPLTEKVLNEKRYEGYLTYSIEVLTPVHISNKINSTGNGNNLHYSKRYFQRNKENGDPVIPASSIRGMIAAFIEAITGSDFGALTIGDEGKGPYAKKYQERHVGFKMQSGDNPNSTHDDKRKFERNVTLPNGFAQRKVEDIARFMFGYVSEKEKEGEVITSKENAQKGRLIFEDVVLSRDIQMIDKKAWDVLGTAAMGSPNPRANVAWYFTAGKPRIRDVNRGRFRVWEILADKVRGRKFYFHQDPDRCFNYYKQYWKKPHSEKLVKNSENWVPLVDYDVESIMPSQIISNGRIDYKDMPLSLIKLLLFSLELEPALAHKLGGLKPFGFGSIIIRVNELNYRAIDDVFNNWNTTRDELEKLKIDELQDKKAIMWLNRILHFPDKAEKGDFIFVYPPYRQEIGPGYLRQFRLNPSEYKLSAHQKGFAQPEMVRDSKTPPLPGKSTKTTLFFDVYQKNASNFNKVMNNLEYSHV